MIIAATKALLNSQRGMSVTDAVDPIPKIWSQADRVTGWGMGLSGFKVASVVGLERSDQGDDERGDEDQGEEHQHDVAHEPPDRHLRHRWALIWSGPP